MKNRQKAKVKEFHRLKVKITVSVMGNLLIAAAVIYLLYSFVLRGHFANMMVAVFQKLFHMDYYGARDLYQLNFRDNNQWIVLLAGAVSFLSLHQIYLRLIVKYFNEVNNGMDALADGLPEKIALSPELEDAEERLNVIRQTIEQGKLEAQLSEQKKNDLIIYLAHDLKTPLASVIGYLNLLHDEGNISEELRGKYISITLKKAERLEDLINEFFEISRYSLTNITLQYSRIDLTRLLEMLLYEFQPMLEEKNLTCALHREEALPLKCDADKIQRVFDNLMRNAVLYSYEETEIHIFVTEQEEKVLLRFENRGDTIPGDKLEHIFEQFYRLDEARSTSTGGAGLGLAIARQIVELHKGTITAKSENERTVFEVVLPKM